MTEITRVPLRPIAKGTVTKVILGILALIALGAAAAFWTAPGKVKIITVTAGSGNSPQITDVVLVNYTGKLAADGKVFDSDEGAPLPLERMIPGFTEAALQMQKGGKYTIEIPSAKGYGKEEQSNPQTGEIIIPSNSDLVFEIELIDFMSFQDFQMKMQALQQMQQQGGAPGGAGGPGGPGGPGAQGAAGGPNGAPRPGGADGAAVPAPPTP